MRSGTRWVPTWERRSAEIENALSRSERRRSAGRTHCAAALVWFTRRHAAERHGERSDVGASERGGPGRGFRMTRGSMESLVRSDSDTVDFVDCGAFTACGFHRIQEGFSKRGVLDDILNKAVQARFIRADGAGLSWTVQCWKELFSKRNEVKWREPTW